MTGGNLGRGEDEEDGAASEIVRVQQVSVRRSGRTILGPIDLTIRAGERWVVIGENGSGKTTLLSLDLGARESLLDDLSRLAAEARPAAIVLVTHHVEEIPAGFTHGLVMRAGCRVAAGRLEAVLTDGVFSKAFGLSIAVGRGDGRSWAASDADTTASHHRTMMAP